MQKRWNSTWKAWNIIFYMCVVQESWEEWPKNKKVTAFFTPKWKFSMVSRKCPFMVPLLKKEISWKKDEKHLFSTRKNSILLEKFPFWYGSSLLDVMNKTASFLDFSDVVLIFYDFFSIFCLALLTSEQCLLNIAH